MKTLHTTRLTIAALMLSGIFVACDSDNDPGNPEAPVFSSIANLSADENKSEGEIITDVQASGVPNEITYELTGGDHEDAFTIDASTGRLTVLDGAFFNYEENTSLNVEVSATNTSGTASQLITVNINDLEDERYLEYTHSETTFRNGTSVKYGIDEFQELEIWQPLDDTDADRPVIILAGGGIFGAPSSVDRMRGMAFDLVQRGYVTAYVYFRRLNDGCGLFGCDPNNPLAVTLTDASEAYVMNIQDLRGAIRFFKKNADTYGINSDKIYLGGWSTGGAIMINSALAGDNYVPNSGDVVVDNVLNSVISDLGGLDGDLNAGYSSSVAAVMGMMVSMTDLSMIDANDPKVLLMNHADARTDGCSDGERRTDNWEGSWADGHVFQNYGTDAIFNASTNQGISNGLKKTVVHPTIQTEDMDYDYLIETGDKGDSNFCPNISVMTSHNYNFIANFFYRVTNEIN